MKPKYLPAQVNQQRQRKSNS